MNISPLIVALDVPDLEKAINLVDALSDFVDIFKVGPVLFLKYGFRVVEIIKAKGKDVFLDLKFHDIPNTVAEAVKVACEMGVFMITIHAFGGRRMIEAAVAAKGGKLPKILAVTVLTSLGEEDLAELGISRSLKDQVVFLAQLALSSGADGLVCSAWEAKYLRDEISGDYLIVTPGVRPESVCDDQKRVVTPLEAISYGANFVVVGRPIYKSSDPANTAASIYKSLMKSRFGVKEK